MSAVASVIKHTLIAINTFSFELTAAVIVIVALVICKEVLKADELRQATPPYKAFQRSAINIMNSIRRAKPPSLRASFIQSNIDMHQCTQHPPANTEVIHPPKALKPVIESPPKQAVLLPPKQVIEAKPVIESKPVIDPKPVIKKFCSSKVFYTQQKKSANESRLSPKLIQLKTQIMQKAANSIGVPSPEHIARLQNELDMTCYPEYLDGYHSLSVDQKKFLSAIKSGNLSLVKFMVANIADISSNIKFGECQILRECVLSNQLEILQYLKKTFKKELDLNGESGYILRWSSRKGLVAMVQYLLFEQKHQKIDISFFQYQAIEWAIVYGHKDIAKILQKYYRDCKLSTKWNVLQNAEPQQDLGVEFDIFNLPSIYQDIIEMIVNSDDENREKYVDTIKKYVENGCYVKFENNMPWIVASDCANIAVLRFLHSEIGIDPVCCNNYLVRTSLESNHVELLQFAKTIINWENWKQHIEPHLSEYKLLCADNEALLIELDYHHIGGPSTPTKNKNSKEAQPQTPIPWPYASPHVRSKYGILTRSKRKMLVKKGVLEDY